MMPRGFNSDVADFDFFPVDARTEQQARLAELAAQRCRGD